MVVNPLLTKPTLRPSGVETATRVPLGVLFCVPLLLALLALLLLLPLLLPDDEDEPPLELLPLSMNTPAVLITTPFSTYPPAAGIHVAPLLKVCTNVAENPVGSMYLIGLLCA